MDPALAQAAAAPGLGVVHMFMQAHIVVKLVMIGLALSSVICWAIIADKTIKFRALRAGIRDFETNFWSGKSIENVYDEIKGVKRPAGMQAVFISAMGEWLRSQDVLGKAGYDGVKERVNRIMDIQLQREAEAMQSRLLFLATIGSAGPFVGLFGTVWGIMNAFSAIAVSKNTNLATVAPGLAEALFATALGLIAAIPAVVFYNMLTNQAASLSARLANFADEFSAIISRQIDKRA